MRKRERVLFLCMANSCRSQMAEAFLKKYCNEKYEVYSCGVDIKPLDPFAIKVMKEINIDISSQRSKDVTKFLGRMHFDHIIVVCDKAFESCPRIWPGGGERLYWPFSDPATYSGSENERIEKYREVRDQIRQKIIDWLEPKEHFSPKTKTKS